MPYPLPRPPPSRLAWAALGWGLALVALLLGGAALMFAPLLPGAATAAGWGLLGVPLACGFGAFFALRRATHLPRPTLWGGWWTRWLTQRLADAALRPFQRPSQAPAATTPSAAARPSAAALAQEASAAVHKLVAPWARQHPWLLVGSAALLGALLVARRPPAVARLQGASRPAPAVGPSPWPHSLQPAAWASLAAQWALRSWLESRAAAHPRPTPAPPPRPEADAATGRAAPAAPQPLN